MNTPASQAPLAFADVLQQTVANYAHAYVDAGCPHGRSVEGFAWWLEDVDGEWVDAAALQPFLQREGLIDHGQLVA